MNIKKMGLRPSPPMREKRLKRMAKRLSPLFAALIIGLLTPVAAEAASAPRTLIPMGIAVGIELKTPGALVVGLENVDGSGAKEGGSPAQAAGVLPGDLIVRLGSRDVASSADFLDAISKLEDSPVSLTVLRGEKKMQFTLSPVKSDEGAKLGLWIRDSVTGVGTMTYYDPASGVFGALGHSISDADTNVIMPLGSGSIMDATVIDVHQGQSGKPGELCGVFDIKSKTGSILMNSYAGIFGVTASAPALAAERPALPVASENEVKLGTAHILSNISGRDVQEFEVEITRIYHGETSGRSLMLKVTDEKLLAATGGIVQGMSGSPIIQDGKLIGAVTHVLVSDPTKGYGILIDTMLTQCELGGDMSDAA